MIKEYYRQKTIYESGFDFTIYMYREMENAGLMQCKSPVFAGIRVTSKCNLACKHCFAKSKRKENMSLDNFMYIVDKLKEKEIYKLTITGGEPFINAELLEMVKYAKEKGIVISLQTNGTLITPEYVIELSKILENDDWVQVSLDGFSEETYFNTRNSMLYNEIYNNIKRLVEAGINVKLNTVVTNHNYKILDEIYSKATQLNVKKISYTPLMGSIDEADDVYFPKDEDVFEEIKKVIIKMNELNSKVSLDIDGMAVPWGCKELSKYDIVLGPLICPAGQTSIEIDVDGNVYPCPFLFQKEYFMGNIYKESVDDIWKNRCIDELVHGNWISEKECLQCQYQDECGSGCYAAAKHANYNCDIRCSIIREKYKDATFKKSVY